jgi:hypothetical protein
MTLLVPRNVISRRWEGALEARLRRAPIEVFLRAHNIQAPAAGSSLLTDDLVRATIFVVEQSRRVTGGRLSEHQQELVGEMACSICEELALLVCEPDCARVAALVSAAQLLSPGLGLKAAAFRAATAARAFWKKRQSRSVLPIVGKIGVQASIAVRTNGFDELLAALSLIDECLSESGNSHPEGDPIERQPVVSNSAADRRPRLVLIQSMEYPD